MILRKLNKTSSFGKKIALASLVVLAVVMSPIKSYAVGDYGEGSGQPGDPTMSKTSEVGSPVTLTFNDNSEHLKPYYDSINGNRIFLTKYKGFTFFGVVPPSGREGETSINSYSQMYENRFSQSSPSYRYGSKVRVNDLSGASMGNDLEYRYLGYSSYGDPISNPYFRPDVTSSASPGTYKYDIYPWLYTAKCPGGGSIWDNNDFPSSYQKKIGALNLLMAQEESMRMSGWTAESWVAWLSLRTDPSRQSAVFIGTRGGGTYYRDLAVVGPRKNLRVISETVREKSTGNIVGTYTRNSTDANAYTPSYSVPGMLTMDSDYTVTVEVKNMSDTVTELDPSKLDVGWASGSTFSCQETTYADNTYSNTETQSGTIAPQSVKTFTWDFTVNESFSKGARVTANISGYHNFAGDNDETNDDFACLAFKVSDPLGPAGNLGLEYIKLVDDNNKVVSHPTPGESYRIRYYVSYTGPTYRQWKKPKGEPGYWYYPKYNMPLTTVIDSNIPSAYGWNFTQKEVIPMKHSLENGDIITYTTTKKRIYEVPIIKTTGTLPNSCKIADRFEKSPDVPVVRNQLSAVWHELYDLSVSNVKVTPLTERPYVAGYQTFAVTYDIKSVAPSWLKTYEKDTTTVVALKNQSISTKVHVVKGDNTKITE